MPGRRRSPLDGKIRVSGAGHTLPATAPDASIWPLAGSGEPQTRKTITEAPPPVSGRLRDHWELWFPATLGPIRTVTRSGVKQRVQRMELPPTMNDRLHYRVKGPWVKAWRSLACALARSRELPRLERVRVSMVIYRPRIGVADPDNDWGRVKPLLDGLRDAGALAKDTHKHLIIGSVEERRGDHGILLIVDELEPAPTSRADDGAGGAG